ncbi:hypothetical protein Efla_000419 [Eimeria flavescens]
MSCEDCCSSSSPVCCCSNGSRCALCRLPPGALALLCELLSAADLHALHRCCCAAATAFSPHLARQRLLRDFRTSGGFLLLPPSADEARSSSASTPEKATSRAVDQWGSSLSTERTEPAWTETETKAGCSCRLPGAQEARNTPAEVYRQLCANRAANLLLLEGLRCNQGSSSSRGSSRSDDTLIRPVNTSRGSSGSSISSRLPRQLQGSSWVCGAPETAGTSRSSRSASNGSSKHAAGAARGFVPRAIPCCAQAATAGEATACRAVLSAEAAAAAPAPAAAAAALAAAGGACFVLESDHLVAPCIVPFVFSQKCRVLREALASAAAAATPAAASPVAAAAAATLSSAIPSRARATAAAAREAAGLRAAASVVTRGTAHHLAYLHEWHLCGCVFFPAPGEGASALLIAVDSRRRPTAATHALPQQQQEVDAGSSATIRGLLLQQFHISSLRMQQMAAEIPLGDLPTITCCCSFSRTASQQGCLLEESRQETGIAAWDSGARRLIVAQLRPAAMRLPHDQAQQKQHERVLQQLQQGNPGAAGLHDQGSQAGHTDGHQAAAAAAAAAAEAAANAAATVAAAAGLPVKSSWQFLSLPVATNRLQRVPVCMQWAQPRCVSWTSMQPQQRCPHASNLPPLLVGFADGSVSIFMLPHVEELKLLGCASCRRGSPLFSEFVEGRGVCSWGDLLLLLQVECRCSDSPNSGGLSRLTVFLLAIHELSMVAALAAKGAGAGNADLAAAAANASAAADYDAAVAAAAASSTSSESRGGSPEAPDSINYNGQTATLTLKRPCSICFLDVRGSAPQQQQQEQNEVQRAKGDQEKTPELSTWLRRIQAAAERAGASVVSAFDAGRGYLAAGSLAAFSVAESTRNGKGVRWLLRWASPSLESEDYTLATLSRTFAHPRPSEPHQDSQETAARLTMAGRLACSCPAEIGCVAADEQSCFFALKGSSRLFIHPIESRLTERNFLTCLDTQALNAPGVLGKPSRLSRAWLAGQDAERQVQQMALQQLYVTGPFLVAARRHDRMHVLLLPLQCQQHFWPLSNTEQHSPHHLLA